MLTLLVIALLVMLLIGMVAVVGCVESDLQRTTEKMNKGWPERLHIK